jgi:cytochrome c oxidase subunit 2
LRRAPGAGLRATRGALVASRLLPPLHDMIDARDVLPALQSMSWGFPENVAAGGDRIDTLFWTMMLVLTPFLLGVVAFIAYCLVRFRAREGRRAEYVTGFRSAAGTAGIAALLMLLEVPFDVVQERIWTDMTVRSPKPEASTVVEVYAEQFAWNFRLAGKDGRFGTEDDLTFVNRLVVPVGKPVLCRMRSRDVIHSFWLPHFRVKKDVMPGILHEAWFTPEKEGRWEIACAELCGLGHYKMLGIIQVKSAEAWAAWAAEEDEILREDGPGDERKRWDLWDSTQP